MITNAYVIICLIIYLYIQFISKEDKIVTALRLGAFYPPEIKERHQYYRFFLCHFIHIDFLHFVMNAYVIYQLGQFFELILGEFCYFYIILISMIMSSLFCFIASEISEKSQFTITFGASSVAYGFFGAIVGLAFIQGGAYYALFQEFIPVLVINFAFTLFYPGISKLGHLGGFVGGILGIEFLTMLGLLSVF